MLFGVVAGRPFIVSILTIRAINSIQAFTGRPSLIPGIGRIAHWRNKSPGAIILGVVSKNSDAVSEKSCCNGVSNKPLEPISIKSKIEVIAGGNTKDGMFFDAIINHHAPFINQTTHNTIIINLYRCRNNCIPQVQVWAEITYSFQLCFVFDYIEVP